MPSIPQGHYWLLTIPHAHFTPFLPVGCNWIRGQLEQGEGTGYLHWQIVVNFVQKCRLGGVKRVFGDSVHAELSRSSAASDYVWKELTRVAGTQFEIGDKPINRAASKDWDRIRASAVSGNFDDVPSDVFVRCYHQLRSISKDNLRPVAMVRSCHVFGAELGLAKVVVHGKKRAWRLILKLREASSGTVTQAMNTLSWMNFEVASTSHTSSSGLIDIRVSLKLKDQVSCCLHEQSG